MLLLCGCAEPLSTWSVKLISPIGEVTDTWLIQSNGTPRPRCMDGGQIMLRDGGILYSSWEREIVAPVGWRLNVDPVEAKEVEGDMEW